MGSSADDETLDEEDEEDEEDDGEEETPSASSAPRHRFDMVAKASRMTTKLTKLTSSSGAMRGGAPQART